MTQTVLYDRKANPDYIPRVAAVHDLCGYGKCSLGIAIPVVSAGGCDVCPVPTGLFSSHTAFPGWYMHDTTDILSDYLAAWQNIGVEIDAVYSGFLGAPEQVDIIRGLYERYPKALRVVDPVMADHGKVYPTYTPELCAAMAELACDADILTPNLTEAAIILGEEWKGTNISDDEAKRIIDALIAKGAKNVVLKGIQRDDGLIRNFAAGVDIDFFEASNEYLPYMLHGTGDLYCSCLLAAIMAGRTLQEAVEFAGELTHDAMIVSSKQPNFKDRGVSFELLIGRIADLLQKQQLNKNPNRTVQTIKTESYSANNRALFRFGFLRLHFRYAFGFDIARKKKKPTTNKTAMERTPNEGLPVIWVKILTKNVPITAAYLPKMSKNP